MNKVLAQAKAAIGRPLFRQGMVLAGATIVLDQISKLWILHGIALPRRFPQKIELSGIFDLTYTENRGVSFGLFAGGMTSRVLLSILALVVSGFLISWLTKIDRKVTALGAGMILGGALGNVVDRVAYGFVVDFLDFSGLGFPYIFNVADAGINVGVALLLLDALILEPRAKKAAEAPQAAARSDNARNLNEET